MDFIRMGFNGGTFRLATWTGNERENMGGIMRPAHELDMTTHPDALVMKASPDLLAACEAFLRHGGSSEDEWCPMHCIEAARAAIAKAKGV